MNKAEYLHQKHFYIQAYASWTKHWVFYGKFSLRPAQVLLMALRLGFQQIPSGRICKDSVYPMESKSVSEPPHRPHLPSLDPAQVHPPANVHVGAALQLPDTPGDL